MHHQFELHAYAGNGYGVVADRADVIHRRLKSESAARSVAGRMAKKINGPVDLAMAGSADWSDRYITTASPSEFHASGYRFERLT